MGENLRRQMLYYVTYCLAAWIVNYTWIRRSNLVGDVRKEPKCYVVIYKVRTPAGVMAAAKLI